jgi:ribonuclease Z
LIQNGLCATITYQDHDKRAFEWIDSTGAKPWKVTIDMKLHCLGTAGYHPNQNRHTSCFFLPERSILLDAGTGTFRVAPLLESDSIDVFISHAHLDHVVGLTYFLGLAAVTRLKTVRVYGQAKKIEAIKKHLFDKLMFPVDPPIHWIELEQCDGEVRLGDARVRWFELEHPGGCVGYRLDFPDHSMAYVTDTFAKDKASYLQAIQGVDLLLHECNFADKDQEFATLTGHSCTSGVLKVAQQARVEHLVLTHFNPYNATPDPIGLEQYWIDNPTAKSLKVTLAIDELVVEF